MKKSVRLLSAVAVLLFCAGSVHANGYDDGMALFSQGQFAQARLQFNAFYQLNPGDAKAEEAQCMAARCLYEPGLYDKFRTDAAAFAIRYPNSDRTVFLAYCEAMIPYKQEKYDEAAATFTRFATDHPGTNLAAEAEYLSARSLLVLKKYSEFRTAAEAFCGKHPDPADGRTDFLAFHVPYTHYLQSNWDKAVKGLDDFLTSHTQSTFVEPALSSKARALYETDRFDEFDRAVELYQTKFPAGPNIEFLVNARALNSFKQEKWDEAIARALAFRDTYPGSELTPSVELPLAAEAFRKSKQCRRFNDDDAADYWAMQAAAFFHLFRDNVDATLADPNASAALKERLIFERLESYYYAEDRPGLRLAAQAFIERYGEDPSMWMFGMLYLGISKAYDADTGPAMAIFDQILAKPCPDNDMARLNRCLAAHWRGFRAEINGDMDTARACAIVVRDEMTSSAIKSALIVRLKGVLDTLPPEQK